jgi:hypothetical protein
MRIGGASGNKDFLLGITNDANGDVQMLHHILLIDLPGAGNAQKTGAQHAEPLGFIG